MRQKIKVATALKKILNAEQFIVTGSVALAYQGLADPDQCHDLDIIAYNPSNMTFLLARTNNSGDDYDGSDLYIFKYDDVEVNVFVEHTPIPVRDFSQSANGLHYSTVMPILKAKTMYGREKDYKQIMAVAARILAVGK